MKVGNLYQIRKKIWYSCDDDTITGGGFVPENEIVLCLKTDLIDSNMAGDTKIYYTLDCEFLWKEKICKTRLHFLNEETDVSLWFSEEIK